MASRPTAILIPGTLCDARVFEPMKAHLDVEAVDAAPIEHRTTTDAAEAVLAQAPDRFVVAGFSLGGFVALEIMRRAPERLVGAVLIASNANPLAEGQAEARRAEVASARASGMGALIERLWPRYVAPGMRGDARLRRTILNMAEQVGIERFATQAELAITRPDSREMLSTSRTPLLALCGEIDEINPNDRCRAMSVGANARLAELDGVGHFVPLEAPQRAAHAINEWLKELTPCC